jgi:hypothetical protein
MTNALLDGDGQRSERRGRPPPDRHATEGNDGTAGARISAAAGPGLAIRADGRTLEELGAACGIDASRLSRFINGKRDLYFAAAERLCQALGYELMPAKPPRRVKKK